MASTDLVDVMSAAEIVICRGRREGSGSTSEPRTGSTSEPRTSVRSALYSFECGSAAPKLCAPLAFSSSSCFTASRSLRLGTELRPCAGPDVGSHSPSGGASKHGRRAEAGSSCCRCRTGIVRPDQWACAMYPWGGMHPPVGACGTRGQYPSEGSGTTIRGKVNHDQL